MSILIITGGDSSERVISLNSAKQVEKALKETGFEVAIFDLLKEKSELKKEAERFDVLFPVLHGEEGEGGQLHKFLATLKKPVVGTKNYKALRQGWYKIPFKKFCDKNKIPTAFWKSVKNSKDISKFGFPCVLKGSEGGSSIEVFILNSEKDLNLKNVEKLLNSSQKLFVEKYLKGTEVTVGIFANKALPVIEIVPPENGWFDYENKYNSKTKELVNAPSLSPILRKKVQNLALKIHRKLELGSYSRIDFILVGNKFFVLEVNTIPGLTSESLLPKAALANGIAFPQFIKKLVLLAK